MSRNKNHELIMQALYVELTHIAMKEEINLPLIMEGVFQTPFNQIDLFARGVMIKANKNFDKIISELTKALQGWKWDRISRLAQAILIMSYAHYKYVEKVDKAVVIEIAIKLAKKYLDLNEHKFINGVLDKVL
ncbi:MAG: transcription antitermination protein NusB [Bacilli bacterium]|nr:transcription antitermination protein NusB [Bacilli bacterium]